MIVTCPECDTSFQLDESRIPNKGIRVRCSRCKHAFHLGHPSASASEAIDEVAQEAVTNAAVPPPTEDLAETDPNPRAARRSEINNEDAAEWEFNQDIPSTEDDGAAADDGDFFESAFDRDAPSGLDLEGETPEAVADAATDASPALETASEAAAVETPPADEAVDATPPGLRPDASDEGIDLDADEEPPGGLDTDAADGDASAFGSVDDFSSLMDDDPLESIAAPEADETADELRAQAAEASGVYAAEGQADDLGDPEKWDFFDGASMPEAEPPTQGATLGRIGDGPGQSGADAADVWSPGPVAEFAEKGRIALLAESVGRIVGWTVVIVGFALGIVNGLWTSAESFVAGERVTPVGSLEAVDMRAQWLDTARAGRLLVVTGGLRNPSRATATMPAPLEIALLDRMGSPLDLPAVSAGRVLSERQLRELPAEVLTRVRSQAATQLQSASIPAGGQLPFQVVIFDAPAAGLRFEARLAESGRLSLPEPTPEAEPVAIDAVGADDVDANDALALDAVEAGAAEADAIESAEAVVVGTADGVAPDADPVTSTGGSADVPGETAAPGYDDPYGEDAGMGLQDL